MKIVDLNVLLYTINESSPHHAAVLQWWEKAINGDEPLGLAWIVIVGFLRISTNPKIFPQPLEHDLALEKITTWLGLDIIHLITESDDHWRILRSLIKDTGTAGNLTTDAHLAALAIARNSILVSCDNDFSRFDGLRWHNPLS